MRKVGSFDPSACRQDDGPLQGVTQLANVSWPGIGRHPRHRVLPNPHDVSIIFSVEFRKKVPDQYREIIGSVAKGRYFRLKTFKR